VAGEHPDHFQLLVVQQVRFVDHDATGVRPRSACSAAKLIWGSFLSSGQAEVPPFGLIPGDDSYGAGGRILGERHVSTRGQADMRGLVTA